MGVLLARLSQKIDKGPRLPELVRGKLQALEVRVALGAQPLANLGQVLIVEHVVAEVELLDNLAVLDT